MFDSKDVTVNPEAQRLVWDFPTRLFHWLLVVTFSGLWITAELGSEMMQYHVYAGYFMLFLLAFRVCWGVLGTKHAKFISFFPTPNRLKSYITSQKQGTPEKTVGHNPLGALMVFLLLILLSLQAISGLFISDEVYTNGPYFGAVSSDIEKLCNQLHDICFKMLQASIALHIAAVVFYKVVKKQNLIKAMITGKKPAASVPAEQQITGSKWLVALLIAIAVGLLIYWLVAINPPPVDDFYYY